MSCSGTTCKEADANAALRHYQRKRRLAVATMLRLCIRDQISVLRTYDVAGTAEIIMTLAQEYPKLLQCAPLQYSRRKDKPFRPRRGEEPKDALVSQLRCVRGVSEAMARQLAKGHATMKSFMEALCAEADPMQWLMSKGVSRRPTAVLLLEALMGEEALKQENFLNTLKGLSGVPGPVAKDLVKRFGTAHALQEALQGVADPGKVLAAPSGPKLSKAARRALSEAFGSEEYREATMLQSHLKGLSGEALKGVADPGKVLAAPSGPKLSKAARRALSEAFGSEEYREASMLQSRLESVNGVPKQVATRLVEQFPTEAAMSKALLSSPVAGDPVGRAMALGSIRSRPAAMRLVSEFLDGQALEWSALVDLLQRSGVPGRRAGDIVASLDSDRTRLRRALELELEQSGGGSLGLEPSEVKKAMRRLAKESEVKKESNDSRTKALKEEISSFAFLLRAP
eukprot:s3677_g1.t2